MGLRSAQLRLSPYDSRWKTLFREERDCLQAQIGQYVLDIQHIGSTSIPGLPAKPILDIGIAVANFEEAVRCVTPLEKLEFMYKGENGIPRRHYFVKGNPRTHHLHMLEIESGAWRNHLLFRDFLIRNPETASHYAQLKEELVKQFSNDREAYQAGKDSFIKAVLQRAGSTWI
ncbi:MAG TPA: GrpB family protein [Pyrinomonadaceae bacterium]|nr:GrpB family protein [Pyrinomonadaceae bacterium]